MNPNHVDGHVRTAKHQRIVARLPPDSLDIPSQPMPMLQADIIHQTALTPDAKRRRTTVEDVPEDFANYDDFEDSFIDQPGTDHSGPGAQLDADNSDMDDPVSWRDLCQELLGERTFELGEELDDHFQSALKALAEDPTATMRFSRVEELGVVDDGVDMFDFDPTDEDPPETSM
jgi:hypothetical protein